MFDDLIPKNNSVQTQGGIFDDLIPSTSNTPVAPTIEQQKDILRSQGQPVSIKDDRAEPNFGGNIVRDIAKVPIKLLGLNVARAVKGIVNPNAVDPSVSFQNDYFGKVKDSLGTIDEANDKLLNRYKAGEISLARSVVGSLGAPLKESLDIASLAPIGEGVKVATTAFEKGVIPTLNQVTKKSLLEGGKTSLKRGGGFGSGYDIASQLESGDPYKPMQTVGAGALGTAIDFGATSVVPKILKKSVDVVQGKTSLVPDAVSGLVKPDMIMNRVARLNPSDASKFKQLAGESHGSYLAKTGNFNTPETIIENEALKFANSLKEVDTALDSLDGIYKNEYIAKALQELADREKRINVPTEETTKIRNFITKYNQGGVSMAESNEIKRMFERNIKLDFVKQQLPEGIEKATRIDNGLRNWQFETADKLGLKNLRALNKQTQLSRFIVDKLGKKIDAQTGNDALGLTDWIMLSNGDPTAIAGFLTKKLFSSKGVQAKAAKLFNTNTIKSPIKAEFGGKTGLPAKIPGRDYRTTIELLPPKNKVSTTFEPQAQKINTEPIGTRQRLPLLPKKQELTYDNSTTQFSENIADKKALVPKNRYIETVADPRNNQILNDEYNQVFEKQQGRGMDKASVEILQDQLDNHIGKKLLRFVSNKEGELTEGSMSQASADKIDNLMNSSENVSFTEHFNGIDNAKDALRSYNELKRQLKIAREKSSESRVANTLVKNITKKDDTLLKKFLKPRPGFVATAFKNDGDLTTKILKDLEGKTTVSKQYILDATNRGELKQVERDLIRRILDDMDNNPAIKLGDSVKIESTNPLEKGKITYGIVRELKDSKVRVYPSENPLFGGATYDSSRNKITKVKLTDEQIKSIDDSGRRMHEASQDMVPTGKEYVPVSQNLKTNSDTINVSDFAKKVKAELLPLKREPLSNKSPYGDKYQLPKTKYENIALPDELRGNVKNYEEQIYSSPIKTSAGATHFGENTPNYFGHTRIEDMADNKTRRVIEVQSDLYQKGNLGKEIDSQTVKDLSISYKGGDIWEVVDSKGKSLEQFGEKGVDANKARSMAEDFVLKNTKQGEINKLQQYNDPTAHFRMIREEIKKASQDGKTKLQFPTGETAMKIEGLGEQDSFYEVLGQGRARNPITPESMKVGQEISHAGDDKWIITDVLGDGKFKAVQKDKVVDYNGQRYHQNNLPAEVRNRYSEQFDISGKVDTNNPIYKFYEKDVTKYLNKFGGKRVVDDKGVSWVEIPITKEQGEQPVEAFGMIPLGPLGAISGASALGTVGYGAIKARQEKKKVNLPKKR